MLGRVFEYQSPMSVSSGPGIDLRPLEAWNAVLASRLPQTECPVQFGQSFLLWSRTRHSRRHKSWNDEGAPSPVQAANPCVAHGGTVITEAGTHPKVAALVYIAAHAPDEGETESGNGKKFPNNSQPLVKTSDGFLLLDPANFPHDFADDLPAVQAKFMAHTQMPAAAKVFTTPVTNPAWKLKPSWYMVARDDRIINPDLERMYAERAHSHKVEAESARERLGGESNRE